jgi:hypothetical protein
MIKLALTVLSATSSRCNTHRDMRWLVPLAVLSGCLQPPPKGGDGILEPCKRDADCRSGELCAADSGCAFPRDVFTMAITWTVHGAPADVTTCAQFAAVQVSVYGNDYEAQFGFPSFACSIGQFTIERVPVWYVDVGLVAQVPPHYFTKWSGDAEATPHVAFDIAP